MLLIICFLFTVNLLAWGYSPTRVVSVLPVGAKRKQKEGKKHRLDPSKTEKLQCFFCTVSNNILPDAAVFQLVLLVFLPSTFLQPLVVPAFGLFLVQAEEHPLDWHTIIEKGLADVEPTIVYIMSKYILYNLKLC